MANAVLAREVVTASLDKAPLGFEIALVTDDVATLFRRAVEAGATPVADPSTKPWGQTVAYLRDADGHVVELCTPLP